MFRCLLAAFFLAISTFGFAEQQTWYFVRHFEKQKGDNPSLTETGKARSIALAAYFSDKSLNQIYSTDYKRTLETATPVSELKNVKIHSYDPRGLKQFAAELKAKNHVLVVGHSNTTPELLKLLGGENISITEADFGVLYILQNDGVGLTTSTQIVSPE